MIELLIILTLNVICSGAAIIICWKLSRRPRILWIAGEYQGKTKTGKVLWVLNGVYATRDKAVAVCTLKNHFIGSLELDHTPPETAQNLPNAEYPLIKEAV